MKILLVEDEPKVVQFLVQGLEEQSYQVDVAYDGHAGKRMAEKQSYDLLILDVNIPLLNGLALCKEIRSYSNVPILILTAFGDLDDKVKGFEAGADDYLVKPFEFKELLLRLKSLSKRSRPDVQQGNVLKVADLVLNLDKRNAVRQGKTIELTAREFSLLEYLIRNKDKMVSRADIAENVWDIGFETGTNTIDVYMNFIRKKIDKDFGQKLIHTLIGSGYMLKSNP